MDGKVDYTGPELVPSMEHVQELGNGRAQVSIGLMPFIFPLRNLQYLQK
jgi:hypothetical protein